MQLVKKRQSILLLLFGIVFLFMFGSGRGLIARAATVFPEGSQIGGIDVGGKTPEETISLLFSEIEEWKNEDDLIVISDQMTMTVPYDVIQFDIDGSVEQLKEAVKKPWYAFFTKSKPHRIPLIVHVEHSWLMDNFGSHIDLNHVIQSLEETVSYLGVHTIDLRTSTSAEMETVAEITWTAPEEFLFLDYFINYLDGLEISANSRFSFLEDVGERVSHYRAKEGNFFASMLYTLTLQSPLRIIERHSQKIIPAYTEPGLEAYVQKDGEKDLIIANPTHDTYQIEASMNENLVTLALKTNKQSTTFEYKITNSEEVPFRTIVRFDKELIPGHEQVIQEGKNGKRVEVIKVERAVDGSVLAEEFVSRDFYLPVPKIVVKGVPESTESEVENSQETIQDGITTEEMMDVFTRQNSDDEDNQDNAEDDGDEWDDEDIQNLLKVFLYLAYFDEMELQDILEILEDQLDQQQIDFESDDELIYENPDIFK